MRTVGLWWFTWVVVDDNGIIHYAQSLRHGSAIYLGDGGAEALAVGRIPVLGIDVVVGYSGWNIPSINCGVFCPSQRLPPWSCIEGIHIPLARRHSTNRLTPWRGVEAINNPVVR